MSEQIIKLASLKEYDKQMQEAYIKPLVDTIDTVKDWANENFEKKPITEFTEWTHDLVDNQVDLSGVIIHFDTTQTTSAFGTGGYLLTSSNGYKLLYNPANITLILMDSTGLAIKNYYVAGTGWLVFRDTLPEDFGYAVSCSYAVLNDITTKVEKKPGNTAKVNAYNTFTGQNTFIQEVYFGSAENAYIGFDGNEDLSIAHDSGGIHIRSEGDININAVNAIAALSSGTTYIAVNDDNTTDTNADMFYAKAISENGTPLEDKYALKAENERLKAELNGEVTIATFLVDEVLDLGDGSNTITLKNLDGMTEIDWGDGTINTELRHMYTEPGTYVCKIYGVTTIGDDAFTQHSNLMSVTIGDRVTRIGHRAFHECAAIAEVIIPDSVESLGDWAFGRCPSLASVTVGKGVQSIGFYAFYECYNLGSLRMKSTTPIIPGYEVLDLDETFTSTTKILVPKGTKDSYKNTWDMLASQIYEDCNYIIEVNADGTLNIITY